MDAEMVERIVECLRGCGIGESMAADEIAESTGYKLSDVYDALEDLENAKLVEMHPACRKGSDPTYTLTPKGKRHMQPEVQEQPEPEPSKEDVINPEPRPSADRVCRFCGKVLEPNKLRRHENCCGKNPDRPCTPLKFLKKAEPKEEAVEVPSPAEYAEAESNATATLEHYQDPEPEVHEVLEQLNAEGPDIPDEVPVFDEKAERIVGRIEDAIGKAAQVNQLVLESTPGMDRLLMLLNQCQGAIRSGVVMTLEAEITIEPGLSVIIRVEGGARIAE